VALFDFLNRKAKPLPVQGDPNQPAGGLATHVGSGSYGEADPAFLAWLANGGTGTAGSGAVTVSEQSAVTLSAVWACVRVIAESVAQLPLMIVDVSTRGRNRLATEHPVYLLLTLEPNPRQSAFNFWELMIATCVLWGNSYALIERDSLYNPIGLHWVHPRNVTVYEFEGELWYQVNGETRPRPAADVLHIPGLGFNGVTGRSVLSVMRENIALGLSAQKFGTNFYENGANIGSVLETDSKLDDKVIDRLRGQFEKQYTGLQNSHKPIVLEQGLAYKRVGMPPADAQFIETRKIQADEVARGFRVPPHKIGILERSTNNNIEHQGIEFVTDCLGPWLTRAEHECRRKLLRLDQRASYRIKFDRDPLLAGDHAARSTFYKTMWGVGLMSANDIADMEDRDHVEGGDERFVPLNMVPTRLIEKVLLANPPKTGKNDSKPGQKAPKTDENDPK
jgi:HK97 family phage portal protein